MSLPQPTTVDFETEAILPRPDYPPKPVGVAIKYWGKPATYWAWGHPAKNNCTINHAKQALRAAWDQGPLLFQNGKFDLDVAETFLSMKRLPWSCYHDTLFLLFLDDPHQKLLGLKPSAERLLGWQPDEQDAVGDWLVKNQPVPNVKISASQSSDHYFGRYICQAPADLVGRYAIGDVDRTAALFKLLYPKTESRSMLEAYDRERKLMPILLDLERQGVRVDLKRLRQDVDGYSQWHQAVSQWVLKQLKATDLNLDSGQQLVDALLRAGKADQSLMGVTATGKVKADKEALAAGVTDKRLLAALKYRTQLGTCLRTFMGPWLQTAERSDGLIFTTWNQVKNQDQTGTRTGRLSSTPNFQNIPKEFETAPPIIKDLPPLPQVRGYVVPWLPDHVLLGRDYSQQELRILGHFEDGVLRQAYQADPWLDVHEHARKLINQLTGKNFERKPIKNTGFGLIYGMGVGKLAAKNGVTVEVAKEVKDAYLAIFPGLKAMYQDMKLRAAANRPIRTWGGREYYCEPPAIVNERLMSFDYKMLNILIQGSAADCTKQALINYWEAKPASDKLLLSVHDEALASTPKGRLSEAMRVMHDAMEAVEFDVPMLSEGFYGSNWAAIKPYDKEGKRVGRK